MQIAEKQSTFDEVDSINGVTEERSQDTTKASCLEFVHEIFDMANKSNTLLSKSRDGSAEATVIRKEMQKRCKTYCGHILVPLPRMPHESLWYKCSVCGYQSGHPRSLDTCCTPNEAELRRIYIRQYMSQANC